MPCEAPPPPHLNLSLATKKKVTTSASVLVGTHALRRARLYRRRLGNGPHIHFMLVTHCAMHARQRGPYIVKRLNQPPCD